jgi:hypothetical protein
VGGGKLMVVLLPHGSGGASARGALHEHGWHSNAKTDLHKSLTGIRPDDGQLDQIRLLFAYHENTAQDVYIPLKGAFSRLQGPID